jgi:putative phosphoribosyl transferase
MAVALADLGDAGRRLAAMLEHLQSEPVVVLGLPRGGIPVGIRRCPEKAEVIG